MLEKFSDFFKKKKIIDTETEEIPTFAIGELVRKKSDGRLGKISIVRMRTNEYVVSWYAKDISPEDVILTEPKYTDQIMTGDELEKIKPGNIVKDIKNYNL